MKVLIINSVCGIRSTGRICTKIAEWYIARGDEVRIAYGRETVPEEYNDIAIRICGKCNIYINVIKSRMLDNEGFNAKSSTRQFLKWAEQYSPDVLWLHNLHGYYLNVQMLFDWIKSKPNLKVKWTLHDCWAFTGHCSHFVMAKCDQWKNGCRKCVQSREYPKTYIDRCEINYAKKKAAFTGVKNMTIIVPSKWLANLVSQSFLKDYPIEIQYNTVDTDIFKPTPSDFRERYGLQDKIIVLGVASTWNESKGLGDFIKLANMLDDKYTIVLVGLTKKQKASITNKIIAIERTNNAKELAEIYTAADVFINPSKQETFGLTTVEAMACGTPVIVYADTACEEIIGGKGGFVVRQDIDALYQAIVNNHFHSCKRIM